MTDAAPLVETPEAQAPPGGEAAWFSGTGGARLRAAIFNPRGRPRGSVVLSGGRCEAIEKYYETIGDLLDRGFVVLTHDWRGQGLSMRELPDRLKGHARGYKPFLGDYRALLKTYEARLPPPWTVVAHSMGACLALLAMAGGEHRFAGAILSAPMLGVQTGRYSRRTARALTRLHILAGGASRYVNGDPGQPFAHDFAANVLTHDPVRFARNVGLLAAEPRLALGAPTWGWLDFAFRATALLARPERLRSVTVPVVIVSAGLEKLVDNTAQAAAARLLPQGKLITIPGAFHEILMETDEMRNFFLRALDALTGRTAPQPAEAPKPAAATNPPPAASPPPAATPATTAAEAPKMDAPKPAPKKTAARKASAAKAPVAAKTASAAKAKAKSAPAAKAKTKPAAAAKPTPAASKAKAKAVTPVKAPAAKAAPATKTTASAKKPAAPKAAPKPAAKAAAVKTPAKPTMSKAPAKSAAAKAPAAPKKPAVKPAAAKAASKRPPAKA